VSHKPELGAQPSIGFPRHPADHQRLGIDHPPVLEPRAASGLEIRSMNAPLSIGENSPGALQIGGNTAEIWAPMASSEMKSVMAIGSGSTLARLMSISTTARAGLEARRPVRQQSPGESQERFIGFMVQPFSAISSFVFIPDTRVISDLVEPLSHSGLFNIQIDSNAVPPFLLQGL
jgi:hypothetical protein